MSTRPDLEQDLQEKQEESAAVEEVVLRDESDEIIDNLKLKLAALQNRLAQAQQPLSPEPQPARDVGFELAPLLAQRLEAPGADLGNRLEKLIGEVRDPQLRAELEKCRETASFLFHTFRRITLNHQMLADTLQAAPEAIETAAFLEQLRETMVQRGRDTPVIGGDGLPSRLKLAAAPLTVILGTLTDLAFDVFGRADRLEIGADASEVEGGAAHLRVTFDIVSDTPWEGMEDATEVAAIAFRAGVRTHSVVDLLYVEKMISLQGGSLSFYRQEDHVYGFEVVLPVERAD